MKADFSGRNQMPSEPLRVRNKGIKKVLVRDIEDAPWNFRTHPQEQSDALAGVIEELGFYGYPDVYETTEGKLRLCDGHLRKNLLLKKYGPDTEIEVNVTDFDEAEAKKSIVTHDPIAALAGADAAKLEALLATVEFDNPAIRKMLDELADAAGIQRTEEPVAEGAGGDEFDPTPAEAGPTRTALGQIWRVGERHRLFVGDSTVVANLKALLGGRLADLVWTDPPYGVAVASRIGTVGVASSQARADGGDQIANDAMTTEELTVFLRRSFVAIFEVCRPGACWYVAAPHGPIGVAFSITLAELDVWRSSLVWVKDSLVLSRADYHWRHEPIYYGWKPGAGRHPVPTRDQTTVWEFARPKRNAEHPTMKPIGLVARAINNSTDAGDLVLDPYLGSGSTLIAAQRTNRCCYGCELMPKYADVILRRAEDEGMSVELLDTIAHAEPEAPKQKPNPKGKK